MQKLITITIFLLIALQSHAQFLRADYKKAEELRYRPVIVALFDMEEEAGTYCDSIHMAWYNEKIREIFTQHWTLSDSIVFMKSRRVASIIASKSHDYVIFSAGPSREGQQSSSEVFWFPSFTFMLYLSEDGKRFDSRMVDRSLYSSPLMPDMEMTGQLFRGKYIFKLSFAGLSLSENDLVFALNQFCSKINSALPEKKSKGGIYAKKIPKVVSATLKSKTLLIPYDLDPEGIDDNTVAKYYKHPFRIATQEEIENAISSKAENTAYLHYLWSDQQRMFTVAVIDAQSGDLLAVPGPGVARLNKADCQDPGSSYRKLIRIKIKKLKNLSRLIK
ncbi:MAG: hypothetical protein KAT76_02750 [Bacteroidales bacterium]|nr:hypothetical protein [Bacteroidales bacterium]